MLLHTDAFTHRDFYTQTLSHTETLTHRSFYTQKLLHTDAKGLRRTLQNRNFTAVFGDRTSFRAKELRRTRANCNFTSVFGDRTSFRAKRLRRTRANRDFTAIEHRFVPKGCAGPVQIAILRRSNTVSCEKVAPDRCKSRFYVSFWRSNIVSCERVAFRAVSLALPLALREK